MRLIFALAAVLSGAHSAPAAGPYGLGHEPPRSVPAAVSETGGWIGPGVSGSWFDAARSGEGIILQVLPDGRAFAVWFTYPAADEADSAAWLLAAEGIRQDNTLRFDSVVQPRGARFGDAFDPDAVDYPRWGSLVLSFDDCASMTASWEGPPAYGQGSRALQRLSVVDEIDCAGGRQLTPSGARAAAGLRARSGAWFAADRAGEGWLVEDLADGQSLVYWFTFDDGGRQAWLVGQGRREPGQIVVEQVLLGGGTRFGDGFDAAAVALTPWGRLQLAFDDCGAGTVSYESTAPGFGSGQRPVQRLTRLAGAPCVDPARVGPVAGSWEERQRTPEPAQFALALSADQGLLYALGGIGAPRAFRRYDPANDQWSVLPELPAGRDHLAAFALDGSIYMVGGGERGGGDQAVSGYRYQIDSQRWHPVPVLAPSYASSAAVVAGTAYIGDASGRLQQFDPRTERARFIEPPDFTPRDHSQLVAFQDEIWVIAGRSPETTAVRIYDPVSERWRAGPSIRHRRGGFAAAASATVLALSGGEVISTSLYAEARSEWIGAGHDDWSSGPDLPVAVHGTAGAVIEDRFYVVSGGTVPDSSLGTTGRVFALDLHRP